MGLVSSLAVRAAVCHVSCSGLHPLFEIKTVGLTIFGQFCLSLSFSSQKVILSCLCPKLPLLLFPPQTFFGFYEVIIFKNKRKKLRMSYIP